MKHEFTFGVNLYTADFRGVQIDETNRQFCIN